MILLNAQPISLPTGQGIIGPANVPDAFSSLLITVKYFTTATPLFWPNALTVLNAAAQISFDGVTWKQCSTFSTFGGLHLKKGVEVPVTTWGFTLWPGVSRQIRLVFDVAAGPLDSEVGIVAT